mmetsp:Transcript_24807/g.56088  ORF Transcript_24807/g.56088 Transcript_24807/m.56088 type:complete len:363 (-) Transcript_24807:89-1177(-)
MHVSSWFNVDSASWFPPPILMRSFDRARRASISSIKTMQGAIFRARSKSWRTLAAPRPTNSSTNSVAAALRKGTPASAAVARASSVLPDPGGPARSTPLGTLAPSAEYLPGERNISTTSWTWSLDRSMPAMSAKRVTNACEPSACWASMTFLRASPQPFPRPPVMRRIMVQTMPRYTTRNRLLITNCGRPLVRSATICTFAFRSADQSSSLTGYTAVGKRAKSLVPPERYRTHWEAPTTACCTSPPQDVEPSSLSRSKLTETSINFPLRCLRLRMTTNVKKKNMPNNGIIFRSRFPIVLKLRGNRGSFRPSASDFSSFDRSLTRRPLPSVAGLARRSIRKPSQTIRGRAGMGMSRLADHVQD